MSDPEEITSNIYPSLSYDDPRAAIEWLCRAFGLTKRLVVSQPDGTVVHSELSLGPGVVMVGASRPDQGRVSPRGLSGVNMCLSVQIEDPDAHLALAREAGAEIVHDIADEEHGSRGYMARDPEGNLWYFGTYRPGAHWGDDPEVAGPAE